MIVLENIHAGYDEFEVLQGISFSLPRGKNLSIIGPNGCGKTTLLRAIAGVLPFSGTIKLDDTDIRDMKRKELAKKVGMLSQTTQFYFNYTVQETVMMGRFVHEKGGIFGGISKADQNAVEAALQTVGLTDLKDREVDTLSGGQLQRVFLAKIIAQDPDILLLDEPTNHLDLSYQVELIDFLKKWSSKKNKTIIGVLHDINLSMLLSDTVLVMDKGEMKAFGNNKEIYASPVLSEVYGMNIPDYMLSTLKKWEDILPNGSNKKELTM